ncbi:MAG: DUF3618 domain-containing protein [Planctomycetaceae bacterium]
MSSTNRIYNDTDNRGSREIERDIEQTRSAMDRTLDEIGDRLHPRHLLDDVLDLFRSGDGDANAWASEAKRSGRRTLRKIRRNPIPALLVGAGIAYLMMEDEEDDSYRTDRSARWADDRSASGRFNDGRQNKSRGSDRFASAAYEDGYQRDEWNDDGWEPQEAMDWPGPAAAWQDDYDWDDAAFDEQSWAPRAESTLTELQSIISRSDLPSHQRVRSAAAKVLELSGRSRSEIRRALHAQWDDIPEHSGSFVDARTGEPYDASSGKGYGEDWRRLAGCDLLSRKPADSDGDTKDDWHAQADSTLQSVQTALADATSTAKQKLSAVAEHLGSLGTRSSRYASQYGKQSREGIQRLGRTAQRRASEAGRQIRHGATAAGRQIGEGATAAGRQLNTGYTASRDFVADTAEQHPLAAGAAVLGLGLLIGALLPRTRTEDETFGAHSDRAKREAKEAGQEVAQRGQELAASAGEAAKDQLKQQGISPKQVAAKAKGAVAAVGETLTEKAASTGDACQATGQGVSRPRQ